MTLKEEDIWDAETIMLIQGEVLAGWLNEHPEYSGGKTPEEILKRLKEHTFVSVQRVQETLKEMDDYYAVWQKKLEAHQLPDADEKARLFMVKFSRDFLKDKFKVVLEAKL
jgi:hypothetical protein